MPELELIAKQIASTWMPRRDGPLRITNTVLLGLIIQYWFAQFRYEDRNTMKPEKTAP